MTCTGHLQLGSLLVSRLQFRPTMGFAQKEDAMTLDEVSTHAAQSAELLQSVMKLGRYIDISRQTSLH